MSCRPMDAIKKFFHRIKEIIKGQENPDFKLPACSFHFRMFRLPNPAGPENVRLVRKLPVNEIESKQYLTFFFSEFQPMRKWFLNLTLQTK